MISIVASFYFFLTAWFLGLTIIKKLELKLGVKTNLVISGTVGIVVLTQIIFWQSYILPFEAPIILMTLSLITLGCTWWWSRQKIKKIKLKKINKKLYFKNLIFFLFWLIIFLIIWPKMLTREVDGVYAGWVNIWGDWAAHLTYASSFAYGHNFPPQMPILAEAKFSYPFMADFLSAILIKLGSNLFSAMIIPSVILSMLLVGALTIFGGKMTTWLFMFNGGLGFWWWIKDIKTSGLMTIMNNLPQEYTHLEKLANIEWINIIASQVIPQRGFLLGFPVAILIYWLLWRYWNLRDKKNLIAGGLMTSLLPLIHAHSAAIIIAVGSGLMIIELIINKNRVKIIKNWLNFFIPILFFCIPQIIYFYAGSLKNGGFVHWLPGWLAIKRGDGIIWFWFKNLGLMAIWIILGMKLANRKMQLFSLPFWIIFIAANLWLFQPWEWDNTKFFVHWYLIGCFLAAQVINRGFKLKQRIIKIIIFLAFGLTILSGGLDVWRLTQYQHRKIRFWNNDQLNLAEWVKNNTFPEAIFLTTDNHDHWLPTLTGRKIILGFKGWLWTYGFNYSEQETAVNIIYKGLAEAKKWLKKYKIDYIVIGPMERQNMSNINEKFFDDNFPIVYKLGQTKIYSAAY